MAEETFTRELTENDLTTSWGTFQEKWNGTSVDRNTEYFFSIAFGEHNKTCSVHYTSKGKNKEDELKMTFEFDRATLEGVKKTVWLKNGTGDYRKTERGKESSQHFSDEKFTLFILGPRCVFGIDMPHIMLQDLNLKKRVLGNLNKK